MIIISNESQNKIYEVTENNDFLILITKPSKIDLEFKFLKEDITVHIYGIVSLAGSDEATLNIKSKHLSPSANSRVHIKSVLKDNAKFNFEGLIDIAKDAQLTDAYLQNDNLVIGDDAVVNSSPQLEILADDVRASHGVTITTFGEEELFYLKSRGIEENKSENLITHGFLSQVLNGVTAEQLKAYNIPGVIYEKI